MNSSTMRKKTSPTPRCRRCGKSLKNPQSIRLGIGPVCLMREIGERSLGKRRVLRSAVIPPFLILEGEES